MLVLLALSALAFDGESAFAPAFRCELSSGQSAFDSFLGQLDPKTGDLHLSYVVSELGLAFPDCVSLTSDPGGVQSGEHVFFANDHQGQGVGGGIYGSEDSGTTLIMASPKGVPEKVVSQCQTRELEKKGTRLVGVFSCWLADES